MEKLSESIEHLFVFKMPNGKVELMPLDIAVKMNDEHIKARVEEILLNLRNKRTKKDGFEPGWQENIREYHSDRASYNRAIKEKGLVELGYDYIPQESTKVGGIERSLEFALYAKEIGVDLSDNEVDALVSGDLLKDVKIDTGDD